MMTNAVLKEDYTNSIGQTLKPGDKVVCVTTGMGSTSVYVGVFAGVRKVKGYYRNSDQIKVCIEQIPEERIKKVFCEDGTEDECTYSWNSELRQSEKHLTGRRFNWVKKPYFRKSTLQRNRVFKIDTPLSEAKI